MREMRRTIVKQDGITERVRYFASDRGERKRRRKRSRHKGRGDRHRYGSARD